MMIIPSIDIKNGRCVRLTQGDFTKISQYFLLPAEVASQFSEDGASLLHVVDLDGAQNGKISQIECIQSVRKSFTKTMQVGGGIRSSEDIDTLLKIGVNRVVIGSNAVLNGKITTQWLEKYSPEAIVLALDFKIEKEIPYLAVKGWQEHTQKTLWEVLDHYPLLLHVLCTDISKDGMQAGPNFNMYQEIKKRYPTIKIQASGGISSLQDIVTLKKLQVDAAIIGKALHENKIDLQEALRCSK